MAAIYDLSTLGTLNNKITFNDYTASPVFRVKNTHPTRRQIREQDAPIPGMNGVADFQTLMGGEYFVISGQMYPYGEAEYYLGRQMLRNTASLEIQQADPLSDHGYVPYVWYEAGSGRVIFLKVEYVNGLDEDTRKGFTQPFELYGKVKNPTIFSLDAVTTTLGVDTTGTPVGASGFPMGFPVLYGKTTYTGAGGTLINEGSIGAYPAMNIYGPITTPRITNLTTGEYIEVDVSLPYTTDILSISYDLDTAPILTVAGVSYYNKVSSGSTFFKVKPGANQLQLTGSSMSNGSYATVSINSAWPMS